MDERPAEDRPKPDTGKQAEIAFKLYDKDRDGYITKSEMEKLSKTLTKEQIDKVFTRFDADGDGRLSYAEFRKMMNKWLLNGDDDSSKEKNLYSRVMSAVAPIDIWIEPI